MTQPLTCNFGKDFFSARRKLHKHWGFAQKKISRQPMILSVRVDDRGRNSTRFPHRLSHCEGLVASNVTDKPCNAPSDGSASRASYFHFAHAPACLVDASHLKHQCLSVSIFGRLETYFLTGGNPG